jgi:opacity protein-like surface antigen
MRQLKTALAAAVLVAAMSPAAAAAASATHCAMATASTPQVCATASTGHQLVVVVNGKWVVAHPTAQPTGYVTMGHSRTNFSFAATSGQLNSWTSSVTLPAGRLWTIKITVVNGSKSKTISLLTNIL